MSIRLSDHFSYSKLLRFTLPSVLMMVFTSVYCVVDGFFVSNFAGETEFVAVNLVFPVLMILGAFGFMFGTGGSALVAKTLGEGDTARAKSLFSMIVYLSLGTGVVLGALGILWMPQIAALLGAEGELLEHCITYGRIFLLALPVNMLQLAFQSFFITAEKPNFGLYVTLAAGVTNMVLDALFVGLFSWGIAGAAAATAASQAIGGLVPLFYFFRKNGSLLSLGHFRFDGRALLQTCTNGSSELMSNISAAVVGMLYNMQLMRYAGEAGIAAYGVLMYVSFIFVAVFLGYSIGVAPVVSYHHGAQNDRELRSLRKKSVLLIIACSVLMFLSSELLAGVMARLFVGYDPLLAEMTKNAFFIYSFSFLFSGIAIFSSGFFTALNNGPISALISFLRTMVFQIATVLLLPLWFDLNGIWLSVVVAELLSAAVAVLLLCLLRKRYRY